MLSSRYSRRTCPEAAGPDAQELKVFFTSSLPESFGDLRNAANISGKVTRHFAEELEFPEG